VSGSAELDMTMRRLVMEARVARLATVRPDGHPHLVPITFALHEDTIVTAVDHKPKTTDKLQRLRNIKAFPAVSIVIDEYHEDWSRLWWVRADGNAHIVGEGPEHEQAIGWLAAKYAPYRSRPPHGPAIVIAVDRWTSWTG